MNTSDNGAKLLASWSWRLTLLAVAAFLFLVISFVGLRRFDWLICRCYGQCVPSFLLLAALIGCGNRRLQLPACATAFLSPFFSWYLLSDKPSAYFIWCTVCWGGGIIWFLFEMTSFIQSCAKASSCKWLEKMAEHADKFYIYLLIVPLGAIGVANAFVVGSPFQSSFWDAFIQTFHSEPKYLLPIAWNAFVFLKLCCSAVLAVQQVIRRQLASPFEASSCQLDVNEQEIQKNAQENNS